MKAKILVLVAMVVAIALSGCVEGPDKGTPAPTPGVTETVPGVTETVPIETIPVEPKGFEDIDIGTTTASISNNIILIAGNTTDKEKFTRLDTNLADKIRDVDVNDMFIIGIFLNMPGGEITIKEINQVEEGKIRITVNLTGPKEAGAPGGFNPYHIIAVKKESLKVVPETIWEAFTEDDKPLAQTTYP